MRSRPSPFTKTTNTDTACFFWQGDTSRYRCKVPNLSCPESIFILFLAWLSRDLNIATLTELDVYVHTIEEQ